MFPLRLCGGKLLVAVTRERRYGPSRLRVNDDDDDDATRQLCRVLSRRVGSGGVNRFRDDSRVSPDCRLQKRRSMNIFGMFDDRQS